MSTWEDEQSAASSSPREDQFFSSEKTVRAPKPRTAARAMAVVVSILLTKPKARRCTGWRRPVNQHRLPLGDHRFLGSPIESLHMKAVLQAASAGMQEVLAAKPAAGQETLLGVIYWLGLRRGSTHQGNDR
jgi:hypothetical protein